MRAWVAVLLALALPIAAQEEPTGSPNVVLILADDLGLGELGCYGQEKIRTPNVDRLAAEGMRFTRHYSGSPVCAPSRCVLLTGMHTGHSIVRNNWENGGWGPDAPEGQYPLPEGTPTLGSLLQAQGFATMAAGKWGLGGPETAGHPNRQGFDRWTGHLCQRKAHNFYPQWIWRDEEKLWLEGNEEWFSSHQKLDAPLASDDQYYTRYQPGQYACDPMIEDALAFVRANAQRPFFLYYASPIPHAALQVPREYVEAYPAEWDEGPYLGQKGYLPHPSPRRAYAAMVTRLDEEVGRLLDLLDELELADETIVLFTSDNGPTFNGGTDSAFFDSAAGLKGLKTSLWEGGIRAPLVARWPGRIAPGTTSDHLSAFEDLLPTALELVGAPPAEGVDGVSFAPTLLGEGGQREHDYLYWEHGGKQAIRVGDWKGLRRKLKQGDLSLELYDLAADPGETADVAAEHPGVVRALEALLAGARTPSEVYPLPGIDR
jgi:arylsulfatase A-like enzyme